MSKAVITDLQKITTQPIVVLDAAGNPAPIDGVPAWSTTDPTLLEIIPAEDGMTCQIIAVGPLGVAQVVVDADADLGEGVKTISGTADVEVIGSEAVSLAIGFGTPEPK